MNKYSIGACLATIFYIGAIYKLKPNLINDVQLLKLNKFGDFFAGAFAPLAFLWVVVAVFIQAEELKAQREELTETRKEVALATEEQIQHRKVLTEQAAQARKQSQFIGKQTLLLEKEHELRDLDYISKMVDAQITEIASALLEAGGKLSFQIKNFSSEIVGDTGHRALGTVAAPILDKPDDEIFRHFSRNLQNGLRNLEKKKPVEMTPVSRQELRRILNSIALIDDLQKKGNSELMRMKLESIGYFRLQKDLPEALALLRIRAEDV